MDTLLQVGLSNALLAGLLALAALAAGALSRRPALAHGLWLLVLLKLITPPLLPVTLPWPAAEPTPIETEPALPEGAPTVVPLDEAVWVIEEGIEDPPGREEGLALAGEPARADPVPAPAEAAPAALSAWPWKQTAGAVWLGGAAVWFLLAGRRLLRFHRLLRHARRGPRNLQQRAQELAARMELAEAPEVWLLPGRWAPMLWAVGRPQLLLPEALPGALTDRGLDSLILHELAHLRRRDHWVRVLEFVALGLYWWFPLAWLASRQLREAEERCCDAWVVSTAPEAATDYAHALVDTLDFLAEAPGPAPALASGLGQVTDLRRRLTMIVKGTTPRTLGWSGRLAVLGLGALLLPLLPLGARAVGDQKDERRIDIRFADERDEDTHGEATDLKRLEQELARRLAEVQRARAQVEKARAEAARARADAEKRAADAKRRADEATRKHGRRVIRIEIAIASDGKDMKERLAKLQKVLSGLDLGGKVTQIRIVGTKGTAPSTHSAPGSYPPAPRPPAPPTIVPPRAPTPSSGPLAPPTIVPPGAPPHLAPRADRRRLDDLERKLEDVMRQLDALKRDLGRRRPNPKPDPVPSAKPSSRRR